MQAGRSDPYPPAGYVETHRPQTRGQRKFAERVKVLEDILPPPEQEAVAEPPPTPTIEIPVGVTDPVEVRPRRTMHGPVGKPA